MSEPTFDCDLCGGAVESRTGPGRVREFRSGVMLDIPADFPVLTCSECGEMYLSAEESADLERAQERAYTAYVADLIETVMDRAQVTLRELERASALTPTYLSHVKSGRKQLSLSLVRLLQGFALHPEEVKRHLAGRDWRGCETWLLYHKLVSLGSVVVHQGWKDPQQNCDGPPVRQQWETPSQDCEAPTDPVPGINAA